MASAKHCRQVRHESEAAILRSLGGFCNCPCPDLCFCCRSKHGLEIDVADLDAGRLGPVLLFHFAAKRIAYQQPTQVHYECPCMGPRHQRSSMGPAFRARATFNSSRESVS